MSNIKNDTTLYRFVSLRSPELFDETGGGPRRFAFHPDNETGFFFKVINGIKEGKSRRALLRDAAKGFSPITDYELKELAGISFYSLAAWLAKNRTNFDAKQLEAEINNVKLPASKDYELQLWDNLFYQLITQQSFYVKESLMQMLVLDNLIRKSANAKTEEEKFAGYTILAGAKVVLPAVLFEEDSTVAEKPKDDFSEPTANQIKAEVIAKANEDIKALQALKKEVVSIQRQFNKTSQKAYDSAVQKHEDVILPLIDEYNKNWLKEKRAMCDKPLPEGRTSGDYCSQPDVAFPELPKFVFDNPEPADDKTLSVQLSGESLDKLRETGILKTADTYIEILQAVNDTIHEAEAVITENTDTTTPIVIIGGMPFTSKPPVETPPIIKDPAGPLPVAQRFGVRSIGIADYKKVVAHVCCYDAGEVSHIENIMAREIREKTTTRERTEETTTTDSTEQETESLTDTVTSERFQMQTEVAKLIEQQKQTTANATLHTGWGWGSLDASAGYASNTSKEESNRQAVTQGKDLTQRAMERIVTKIKSETVHKTTESFMEENKHGFDNTQGDQHVSGVYRFINAIYKNQIYNYGKRMMYEFMIPQPSKMHLLGMVESTSNTTAVVLQKPIDPRVVGYTSANAITDANYVSLAAGYGAGDVEAPAQAAIYLDFSFSKDGINSPQEPHYPFIGMAGYAGHSAEFKIPEGYEVESISGGYSGREIAGPIKYPRVMIMAGGRDALNPGNTYEQQFGTSGTKINVDFFDKKPRMQLVVSLSTWDQMAFTINIGAKCVRTDEAYKAWQLKTYNAIIAAYKQSLEEYNAALADNTLLKESNPGFYRQTEQAVLRKNCIAYLIDEQKMGEGFYTGTTLNTFAIPQTQALENYAGLAKFMEQAFEWDLISYTFYPYYWAKRSDWTALYQYDCNDPLFRSFMQAGMARVVVTVKPGFEDAVMYFMATGQIWNGGQIPVLGDPLYLSIAEELAEQEYVVEETWETLVPTNLVALQSSGIAIDAGGLPCGDDCADHAGSDLVKNSNTLSVKN